MVAYHGCQLVGYVGQSNKKAGFGCQNKLTDYLNYDAMTNICWICIITATTEASCYSGKSDVIVT